MPVAATEVDKVDVMDESTGRAGIVQNQPRGEVAPNSDRVHTTKLCDDLGPGAMIRV
jgi:hypothetical protein